MSRRILSLVFAACLLATGALARAEVTMRIVLDAQPLAGYQYYAAPRLWDDLREGDALGLVREPDNPYDANAIRVEWRGEKLGYVPRVGNAHIAQMMDRGKTLKARIAKLQAGRRRWQRVLVEILLEE